MITAHISTGLQQAFKKQNRCKINNLWKYRNYNQHHSHLFHKHFISRNSQNRKPNQPLPVHSKSKFLANNLKPYLTSNLHWNFHSPSLCHHAIKVRQSSHFQNNRRKQHNKRPFHGSSISCNNFPIFSKPHSNRNFPNHRNFKSSNFISR